MSASARTRIKICGLTSFDDAMLAVRLGADAVGFVLWPGSPRAISAEEAGRIARRLPAFVNRVGVFVNATRSDVEAARDTAGLDVVQLHGAMILADFAELVARVVRATSLHVESEVDEAAGWPAAVTPIVDAHDPERHGGTGRTADWTRAARLSRTRDIVLAGGLNAGNVQRAIATVKPFAVDVSSGVESSPGRKDPEKLRAFFAAVRAIEEDTR